VTSTYPLHADLAAGCLFLWFLRQMTGLSLQKAEQLLQSGRTLALLGTRLFDDDYSPCVILKCFALDPPLS
jgi:hypothetical protein